MKLRTIRTFDEIEAFYTMIRDQYPGYSNPRLSPVHYGVLDVGEDAKGYGEGERLVPWYKRFSFRVTCEAGGELYMERESDIERELDDDGEFVAPRLRRRAANRFYSEDKYGLELNDFTLSP